MSRRLAGGLLAAAAAVVGCGRTPEAADLVLLHGRIVTLDAGHPEATALAVAGDRIAAVGTDREIERLVGPATEVLDLEGRLAVPGFVEAHAHLMKIGQTKATLDLAGTRSWEEIVVRVRQAAAGARPGEWIFGRGWHQEKWDHPPGSSVRGFPVHDELSAASPDNPVHLRHASGHGSIDNARAMERAGIGASTPDPPGGEILRRPDGSPAGVFLENAEDPLLAAYERDLAGRAPEEYRAERRRWLALGIEECLSKGITSFHDAGASFEDVDLLRAMADEGRLALRLYVMLDGDQPDLAARLDAYRIVGHGSHHLTVRAIKSYVDGALGARGAWLLEPYADLPGSAGQNVRPVRFLEDLGRTALSHGFQLCVHAIGDRGNREVLDLYERLLEGRSDHRWRIEHAQHLHPDDIPRFARLGVVAAMQGVHCASDGPWVVDRIGERRAGEGAYAWRRLLASGAVVANGTDAPVEDVDPIASFHASVTRRMADGGEFFPEQRMTREEALRSYTVAGAWAAFEEEIKGTLSPGKLADVTVLSRDILTVPDQEIPGTAVVYTIVGGKVAYRGAGR